MNELRKEIERQFKAHCLLDGRRSTEKTDAAEPDVSAAEKETPPGNSAAAPRKAPANYSGKFASDFINLPEDWQIFLCEHETLNDEKYNRLAGHLQAYGHLEDMYEHNRLRLQEQGFRKIQDWLEGLVWVDEQLASRPAETIKALAAVYGVNLGGKSPSVSADTVARIGALERNFHEMAEYLAGQRAGRLEEALDMFGRQTDSGGNLLHPYFDMVKNLVRELLSGGAAASVNEAYEQALWITPQTRGKLIEEQISSRAAEAQKARKAAFAPKGKSEAPERPLTLREELEKNMATLID